MLYAINNLGTIHAKLAAPAGYAPFGVLRDSDVAQYLTWINGLRLGWFLPNYHAPWITSPGLFVPGLYPVAILTRILPLSVAASFQIFNLAAYICTAYVLAFAYRTFCETRAQALWAFLVALACVPLAALPGFASLVRLHPLGPAVFGSTGGVSEFSLVSDGFLHGLSTWPLIAYGTCLLVLGMTLLARFCITHEAHWLRRLAFVSFLAALVHPFEIFVLLTVSTIVLIRLGTSLRETLTRVLLVIVPAALGFLPYIVEANRFDWVRQVSLANCSLPLVMPSRVIAAIGIPAVLALILLFLNLPRRSDEKTMILKVWFAATFVLLYVPGLPFPLHMLDGIFVCIGLLLVAQLKDVLAGRQFLSKSASYAIAGVLLAWTLFPHLAFRVRAWHDAINPNSNGVTTFAAAIAPADEHATVAWLRNNASPDDLVLATEDAAPWIATAPVHSFASHWLFSSEDTRPGDMLFREKFFHGELAPAVAERFLKILGARFVVVPDNSNALQYLSSANLRAHLKSWSIYELPGQQIKPYLDPRLVDVGAGTLR
ncbi:MAG TPA: hypothetical protein VG897_12670 [Terriglobales bacterium]|nr:hypothetical protein [Terriglobales bacterium]